MEGDSSSFYSLLSILLDELLNRNFKIARELDVRNVVRKRIFEDDLLLGYFARFGFLFRDKIKSFEIKEELLNLHIK